MELYSYKNQEPEELPTRIRLDSGGTVTSLSELTKEELEELGFVGPILKPEFDSNSQTIKWNGSEYVVLDLSKEEIDVIKQNQIPYDSFSSRFLESSLILRLKEESKVSLELKEIYYDLIISLKELEVLRCFRQVQKCINLMHFLLNPSDAELKEIDTILLESGVSEFITLPNEEYDSKYYYDTELKRIEHKKGPFESWTLVDGKWKSPVPYPSDRKVYIWNESEKNWVLI